MVAPIVQLIFPRPIFKHFEIDSFKLVFKYTPPVCISQGNEVVKQTQ